MAEAGPRGQLTFEQEDGLPDYLSPKARGCGQAQPTSGTPETQPDPNPTQSQAGTIQHGKGKYLCVLLELPEGRA